MIQEEQKSKYKIMHQVAFHNGLGGPSKALQRLMASSEMQKFDMSILEQTIPTKKGVFKVISQYVQAIKKYNPDLIHVRGVQTDGLMCLLAAKIAKVPHTVMSVNGMASDLKQIGRIKKFIAEFIIEPLSFTLADRVFTVYQACLNRRKIKRFGNKVCDWIYNPLPNWDCSEKNELNQEVRRELGIEESDIIALCVSRVTYEKGFSFVIEAAKQMEARWPAHFKMVILGSGNYIGRIKAELAKQISEQKIILVNATPDVRKYYLSANAFFTASLHENHSNAILEACAAHIPSVVTDVGGNAESIEDGVGGWVIRPQNSQELTQKFMKIAGMSQAELSEYGEQAYEFATKKFNSHLVYSQLAKFYINTINKK